MYYFSRIERSGISRELLEKQKKKEIHPKVPKTKDCSLHNSGKTSNDLSIIVSKIRRRTQIVHHTTVEGLYLSLIMMITELPNVLFHAKRTGRNDVLDTEINRHSKRSKVKLGQNPSIVAINND